MNEAQIEEKLGKEIRKRGGLYYKFVSPGNSGVPDRIVVTPDGRTIYVELKKSDGGLRKLQRVQIKALRDRGAAVYVVYGWEDAEKLVEEVFADEVRTAPVSRILHTENN